MARLPGSVHGVVVQSGLLDHRPHHRLRALVEPAIHQELADLADDLRLGGVAHGGVSVRPVAVDAEALELRPLDSDPMGGEVAAFLAEFEDRHRILGQFPGAVFLLDHPFDRQAVAVPAGDIDRVLAHHLLRPVDHVLQDLVEGVADMEIAVGVRRAVMEDEFLAPLRGRAQPPPQIHCRPALQQSRLALRQIAAHRKLGLRQEDGRAVVDGQ